MELIEGSEKEDWICDFCESYSKNHVGEQLQAWRCPEDIRDPNLGYMKARGCDYDICNNCIKEYRVSENSENVNYFDMSFFAEEASELHQGKILRSSSGEHAEHHHQTLQVVEWRRGKPA